MWLDRVSKPGPLAHESDTLLTGLCGPALWLELGASTDGSVEDLSLTGLCSFICATVRKHTQSKHHIPWHPAKGEGIKSFKENQVMVLKPIRPVHMYGFRTETKIWFQSTMTSGLIILSSNSSICCPEAQHLNGHLVCLQCS